MQITLDIDDNKVADQILEMLGRYKKKGIKISMTERYVSNNSNNLDSGVIRDQQEEKSIQARFQSILGKYATERANVSIGEDRRIYQDALWEKYGQ